MKQLAINGGDKAVTALPERFHFGAEELAAVRKLFETAITTGCAPGYNGPEEEAFCREFADYLGGGWVDGRRLYEMVRGKRPCVPNLQGHHARRVLVLP